MWPVRPRRRDSKQAGRQTLPGQDRARVSFMTLRERTNERSQEAVAVRPHVRGKFLYAGDEKLYVRGVTYSAFATDSDGNELFAADQVEHDFAAIAANGFNAVRVYTVPPRWLLDVAQQHQLRVMVGLPVEQHHAFLDEPGRARAIVERVRAAVRQCTGHPAVLCYVAGNEIPAAIVRWHGARR